MNIYSLQASIIHYIYTAQYDDLCTSLSHDKNKREEINRK